MWRRSPGPMRRDSAGGAVGDSDTAGVWVVWGGGAEDAGSWATVTKGQERSTTPSARLGMISGVRIRGPIVGMLEDEAKDRVVGDLTAEGVVRGQDFVTGGFAGLSGNEDSIGYLCEHESVSKNGGGTLDDDEAEFVAPRSQQSGHAR